MNGRRPWTMASTFLVEVLYFSAALSLTDARLSILGTGICIVLIAGVIAERLVVPDPGGPVTLLLFPGAGLMAYAIVSSARDGRNLAAAVGLLASLTVVARILHSTRSRRRMPGKPAHHT